MESIRKEDTAHEQNINADIADMGRKLKIYVEKGRVTGSAKAREEPVISAKPDVSLIKPLKKMSYFPGRFIAVDCSTRTLKRANNWGIYLMRAAYASVKEREVGWSYLERVYTAVGDVHVRRSFLQDVRIEMESQIALNLLGDNAFRMRDVHEDAPTYLLLDGGGYFGGERKFRVSLYEKCKDDGISLLAISKNSPSLHDEEGRDFIAATYTISPHDLWVYYPVRKADVHEHLYGDIAVLKLCRDAPRVFRCDIMEYLTDQEITELLSPLTCISEDPRCLGYPIPLWLAHEFSTPSDSMLLSYHDQIEDTLSAAGLLDALRREELSCSFADEIHGIKHAYEWEWWDGQL